MHPIVDAMDCRSGCGACCIAPSISSPIPGMPQGKPAGIPCVQLLPDYRCALFGRPERPAVCASLRPNDAMCGANRDDAIRILTAMETATAPKPKAGNAGAPPAAR
ncbi:MAG TPA: YkgJ family cysteine cluster protein [Opitutaceae bacterium]|nr:YkgJ family cysteine cluster protein [Opitutaceae bacterium]